MAPTLLATPQTGSPVLPQNHPVMLTALLYLHEALRAENYEICAMCIQIAREFGAAESAIRTTLENPFRK